MMITELTPQYDKCKSFYGKAHIIQDGESCILRSYSTNVAEIVNGAVKIHGFYSQTTTRHIKEFLHQMGFAVGTKRELERLYC